MRLIKKTYSVCVSGEIFIPDVMACIILMHELPVSVFKCCSHGRKKSLMFMSFPRETRFLCWFFSSVLLSWGSKKKRILH